MDWREHAAHKEGVERCRTQNLPAAHCSGPGVYELGVTTPSWLPTPAAGVQGGASSTTTNTTTNASTPALRRRDVVVVYVGQADNIRKRLQEFGQPGAHLERSRYFANYIYIQLFTNSFKFPFSSHYAANEFYSWAQQ